jgi:hypothetical protein
MDLLTCLFIYLRPFTASKVRTCSIILRFSCGYERRFLTLRAKDELRVLETRLGKYLDLQRDEVTEQFRILCEEELCDLYVSVNNGSGAHPASYPRVRGALSLGVKRPGREADHSPPPGTEVRE